jgi:hypothetical protein
VVSAQRGVRDDRAVTRWRRDDGTFWRATPGGRVVVLGARAGEPSSLSGPGVLVWSVLAEPCTLEQLTSRLASVYGADDEVVAHDVARLLESLVEIGAVRTDP